MRIATVCHKTDIVLVRQTTDDSSHFLPYRCQFLLLHVDINNEKIGISMACIRLSRSELESCVISHELIRQFSRSDMLRVVWGECGDGTTETASY